MVLFLIIESKLCFVTMNFRVLLMLHVADHFILIELQFTTDGCLTNLYADDSILYASGNNILEVQQK